MENFITSDFDEWRNEITKQYKKDLPDKLIFPEEVKEYATGYMISPVGHVDGVVLMAVTYTSDSLKSAYEYFNRLNETYNIFPYQVLWRHIQVDGYTLNSYIFKFATLEKGSL